MRLKKNFLLLATVSVTLWFSYAAATSCLANERWPQWRGPSQNGIALGQNYPLQWSDESGIAWQIELPGRGGSTPVVDGAVAYLTAGVDQKNVLMAIDVANGKVLWQTELGSDRGNKHRKGSGSNPSPVIDGDAVFAYFRSGDLACVDKEGTIRWQINLQDRYGQDSLWWDLGSSPTLTGSAVVVAVMQTGPSYLVALDKRTGEVLWKTSRMLGAPEEAAQSYSTPLAVNVNGKNMIAVMGADHLTLHNAASGREIARLGGFNPDGDKFFRSISSPVADGNVIVCPYARGSTLTGVLMDQLAAGKGKKSIAWFRDDLGSDVPTPAAVDKRVYVVGDGKGARKGTISCLDSETGETVWSLTLPRSRGSLTFSSSPLVAGDHLYVTQEDATTFVIGPLSSDQPKVVAVNRLSDSEPFTVASPVPSGSSLLLRSRTRLWKFSGE